MYRVWERKLDAFLSFKMSSLSKWDLFTRISDEVVLDTDNLKEI